MQDYNNNVERVGVFIKWMNYCFCVLVNPFYSGKSFFYVNSIVKYSLADNMGQGKNPTVPSQIDAPEENNLWTAWQLFPLDDDQTCHSKDGGSAYSVGQLWEEIAGAWRCVYISAWEFDSNKRLTNWTEDSEKFLCSLKIVLSLPRVRFLGYHLLTPKSPGLIDERF